MAVWHWKRKLSHLCFVSWLKYTRHRLHKKTLLMEHENKAKKMAMFLEAASKGMLWKDNDSDGQCESVFSVSAKSVDVANTRNQSEPRKVFSRPETAEMIVSLLSILLL